MATGLEARNRVADLAQKLVAAQKQEVSAAQELVTAAAQTEKARYRNYCSSPDVFSLIGILCRYRQ